MDKIKNGDINPMCIASMSYQELYPAHWKRMMDEKYKKEKKKLMVRNIRTIFEKANLTEQEIKIILGIIKVLKNKKFS